jgi:hypothetical protein
MPHQAGANGKFGSNGAFKFDVPGRKNMEVHSGRRDKTDKWGHHGYKYVTLGCIRTTDEAMKQINDINKTDKLQNIEVVNFCD